MLTRLLLDSIPRWWLHDLSYPQLRNTFIPLGLDGARWVPQRKRIESRQRADQGVSKLQCSALSFRLLPEAGRCIDLE